jgi:hypothetical protein
VNLQLTQVLKDSNMDGVKIQLGQLTMNKTARFIKPCLKLYGEEFRKRISSVFKLAYGIGDMYINKKYEKHIFILIDTFKCSKHFLSTLEWLQEQDCYEDDYAYDNLVHGRLHMIVIKLPEGIDLQLFLKGKYSKMYTDTEIISMLDDETKSIVIKDKNYKVTFVEKVNALFKSNLKVSDLTAETELDTPPNIPFSEEQEIFI